MRALRRRRAKRAAPVEKIASAVPSPPEAAEGDPAEVHQWIEFWDADSQHVAATGEHLGTVMWNDDGAVGLRGWYY